MVSDSTLRHRAGQATGNPKQPMAWQDKTLPVDKKNAGEDGSSAPRYPAITAALAGLMSQWLAVGAIVGLIFGGCCSNVYALEAIIKVEPQSGTLLTFIQFVFVAITGYVSQFDRTRPPFFLTPNRVPIRRWIGSIVLFFAVNVLNNHAFSYSISVPVHIILRSGGSITTMIAGTIWGKRYSAIQIVAVCLLTVGVGTAAWCDSQAKSSDPTADPAQSSFGTGLMTLFVAQILSAIMGLYTEETYRQFGPQWRENLFYSHLLSLPLFLPFLPGIIRQLRLLAQSPPLAFGPAAAAAISPNPSLALGPVSAKQPAEPGAALPGRLMQVPVPGQIAYLVINVLTQYACIRGVNLLAAVSSALTVTIVLNVRKLVSLLLSIWLFGNRLSMGTLLGAVIVFGGGALYSLESRPRRAPAVPQKC